MGHENFEEMRKAMVVSQLRTTDVSDPRVITAMAEVPREEFVPAANRSIAYADRGVAIGEGRALNSPLATGLLINAANIRADDHVLIVGAATGYTAAVVSKLAGSVVALEQSAKLVAKAQANLASYGTVSVEKGNLTDGFDKSGPYSVILVDGVVDQITDPVVNQLKNNGRLVAAISDSGVARLALGRKVEGIVSYQYFADCGGCELPGFEKSKSFQF
ncbi:MAG: protein-L-isoaspartate O-methyltransferase [Parasphingorhabdus sp.]